MVKINICCGITKKNLPCQRKVSNKLNKESVFCFSHKNQNLVSLGFIEESYFKPFLKWVGGKQSSLKTIESKIPKKINSYHEFFLGGGSMLLRVLYLKFSYQIKVQEFNVSDLNFDLINVYLIIKHEWKALYKCLKKYNSQYVLKQNLYEKKEFYINVRNIFNINKNIESSNRVNRAAMFIFLNKTCFRGMFRINKKGEFNVPFGNYVKPQILIEKLKLEFISKIFKEVNFYCMDYKDAFKKVKSGDFIFLDPPYFPDNKNFFLAYNSVYFTLEEHQKLFNLIKLVSLKTSFLLSNSNTPFVLNFFKEFFITEILIKTRMNCKNPGQQKIELLINNIK